MKTEKSEKWILGGTLIYEGDDVVCDVGESDFTAFEDVEHGEKIVRAVNAHDALVEALEKSKEAMRLHDIRSNTGNFCDEIETAASALRLAKEGK